MMKKLNNQLNWRGFKGDIIGDIVQRKLKSDYSVRDKLDCPKSTNKLGFADILYKNDTIDFEQVYQEFCLLAKIEFYKYKNKYILNFGKRVKALDAYRFISYIHKADGSYSSKLKTIEKFIDDIKDAELKDALFFALDVAKHNALPLSECGIPRR